MSRWQHSKPPGASGLSDTAIAIVGLACRFPGGVHDASSYWELLMGGRDAVGTVPKQRWDSLRHSSPSSANGKISSNQAGLLQDVRSFDHEFFRISPREAAAMDPQQRLLLELAWEALEDSGIIPDSLSATASSVYMGVAGHDYADLQDFRTASAHSSTGLANSITANRISHFFDLRGPSVVVDTACSSGLAAFHLACQALRYGESPLALAGACNLLLNTLTSFAFSQMGMLSPSGRCRAFDAEADGYVRGEGAAVLVLKPLAQAVSDGDRIHAVVLSSKLNQDGHSRGLTVPNQEAQSRLLEEIYTPEILKVGEVSYIEAHGTGTPVGDPIEAAALGKVLGSRAKAEGRELPIGSVKTNIGHLETASGMAGLLKGILVLKHRKIPPSLHQSAPHPDIPFRELGLTVPQKSLDLTAAHPLVGVNSFGFGGTNGHVILAPAPLPEEERARQKPWCGSHCLPISARKPENLKMLIKRYQEKLEQAETQLPSFLSAAALKRQHHPHREAVWGGSREELLAALERLVLEGVEERKGQKLQLAFVFCGQGSQWCSMGRELLEADPIFRETIERCEQVVRKLVGWSLTEELKAPKETSRLGQTEVAQVAIFALQAGLVRMLRQVGVTPQAVVGHSVGEIAAAYTAGVLSLEDATYLAVQRGRIMGSASKGGAMLAVGSSKEELEPFLQDLELSLAAVNHPRLLTLSGTPQEVSELEERLEHTELFRRRLPVNDAFHSALMDPARDPLLQALRSLHPSEARLGLMSTVTGRWSEGTDWDEHYHWKNVRQTVLFSQAVQALLEEGYNAFLEIGPHPVLSSSLQEIASAKDQSVRVIPSLKRQEAGDRCAQDCLTELYRAGYPLKWENLYSPLPSCDLPSYPWSRTSHWTDSLYHRRELSDRVVHPLLGVPRHQAQASWRLDLQLTESPYFRDHCLGQSPLFPAAAYVEMGLAAAGETSEQETWSLEQLNFSKAWFLREGEVLEALCQVEPSRSSFTISSLEQESWTERCSGFLSELPCPLSPLSLLWNSEEKSWSGPEEFYERLRGGEFHYGPAFRTVRRWKLERETLLAELHFEGRGDYFLHPCLLDGCFQLAGMLLGSHQTVLPVGLESLQLAERGVTTLKVTLTRRSEYVVDLGLYRTSGSPVASIQGLRFQPLAPSLELNSLLYELHWQPVEAAEPPSREAPLSVQVRGSGEFSEHLKALLPNSTGSPSPQHRVVLFERDYEPAELALEFREIVERAAPETRLWLVTTACRKLPGTSLSKPKLRMLWSMARVLRREQSGRKLTLVELGGLDPAQECANLLEELSCESPEEELGFAGSKRYLPSLQRLNIAATRERNLRSLQEGERVLLGQDLPGTLDTLVLELERDSQLEAESVKVQIAYAGINFSDILKALKIYPGTPGGPLPMGLEFSGVVIETGSAVQSFQRGDRVMGLAAGESAFSNLLTVPEDFLAPVPHSLSLEEAATLPVAFTTVDHCLRDVARLGSGERLLIHSASGAVGLAAIAYAKRVGAQVFATAGTEEKRSYLEGLDLTWVGDSRSLDFFHQIREATAGRGVDVVLNSLVGEARKKSLQLLTPGGRFLELGKRDHYLNTPLDSAVFRNNITYVGVDLEQVIKNEAPVLRTSLARLGEALQEGWLPPFPRSSFPVERAQEAFRLMSGATHLGKVILDFQLVQNCRASIPVRSNRSYLLSGASRGLGLEVAQWLAERGARHLYLLSRGGNLEREDRSRFERLKSRYPKLQIHLVACDVADRDALKQILIELERPLGGVFHLAAVIEDAAFLDADQEHLERVFRPKVQGAQLLHELTQTWDIDCFVMFGSISSLLGPPGQFSYASANAYLAGLAQLRRQMGLPATVIHWGALSQSGHLARSPKLQAYFERMGLNALSLQEMRGLLNFAMRHNLTELTAARVDWSGLLTKGDSKLFRALRESSEQGEAAQGNLLERLHARVAETLGVPARELDLDTPLRELGLDSLMAFELKSWLQDRGGHSLDSSLLLQGPSIRQLVQSLGSCDREESVPSDSVLEASGEEPERAVPVKRPPERVTPVEQIAPRSEAFDLANRPDFLRYRQSRHMARALGVEIPFFVPHQGIASATSRVEGQELINLASYNYLGLSGHSLVTQRSIEALQKYGSSVSASRLIAGERPIHRELERELAEFLGTEEALTLVSGHATNVTLIPLLISREGLILHDALAHDSVIQGARASRATRRSFRHNDLEHLEQMLAQTSPYHQDILVVVEGLYSMDGDCPDLPQLLSLKERYGFFLLIDEAHSLGVLGETGRGLAEHWSCGRDRDVLWMGTLSKALASCGGYIAGHSEVIDYLRYHLPGFVFSVGMTPASTASALTALQILRREPQRVKLLQQRAQQLFRWMKEAGYDVGEAQGFPIIPLLIGGPQETLELAEQLKSAGVYTTPILFPAVPEGQERLRFFLSSEHTEQQLRTVLETLLALYPPAQASTRSLSHKSETTNA